MTVQSTNAKPQEANSKILAPKEIEKMSQNSALNLQKVKPQLNQRNLKLIANQAQSKPAIVRRNSPNQG
jgi:hypothetical protein